MHPFFTTTLSLPEKRKVRRSVSVATESTSASWILRRNSAKVLSSIVGSLSFMLGTSARTTKTCDTFDFGTGVSSQSTKLLL